MAVIAGVLVAAGFVVSSPGVQRRFLKSAAEKTTVPPDRSLLAEEGDPRRRCRAPRRAKACVAVLAAGKIFIVDVGPESVENLVRWNLPLADVGGVLLTHFRSDHIGDLGELNLQTWAAGRPAALQVYGGPGVEQVVEGFNLAYRHDQGHRTAHHTARVMNPDTWPMIPHAVGPGTVLEENSLKITAFEADHPPIVPAYGYRFDYKGRSVVVTGDTKYNPRIAQASAGADVMCARPIGSDEVRTSRVAK